MARDISQGNGHWCALLKNGQVYCEGGYGSGHASGAGPGVVSLGTGRTARQVSVGTQHSCAVLDDYSLKCWGYNDYGQLGLGHTNTIGDAATEMGDQLPTVDVGTGRTVLQVDAGGANTCAILDNTTLKCWGANFEGSLGYGDRIVRGDNPNEMGDNLPAVSLGSTSPISRVVAGGSSSYTVEYGRTCALFENGTVKCWGGSLETKPPTPAQLLPLDFGLNDRPANP